MNLLKHKLSPRRLIVLGVTLLFLFALVVGYLQSQSVSAMYSTRASLRQSRAIQSALNNLRVSLLQAESNQRGYLVTHDADYLGPCREAEADSSAQFASLHALTSGNVVQQNHLNELQPLLNAKIQFMEQTITLETGGNHAAAVQLVVGGEGNETMKSIVSILGSMQDVEAQVLADGQSNYQRHFKYNATLSVVSLGLCLGTIILILFIVRYLEQLQANLMRNALTEVFKYEKGDISVTEYMQRRLREMENNGITRNEARRLLGLEEAELPSGQLTGN